MPHALSARGRHLGAVPADCPHATSRPARLYGPRDRPDPVTNRDVGPWLVWNSSLL